MPVSIFSRVLPVLILLSIWVPVFSYFYVPSEVIDDATLQQLKASPSDDVIDEISKTSLIHELAPSSWQKLEIAEHILEGKFSIPRYPKIEISRTFDPRDLHKGGPTFQLLTASLLIPKYLLDAYEISGDEKYFRAASDYIISWAQYEREAWLEPGYLWNDHAIAQRVYILGRLWRWYRHHEQYNNDDARLIVESVVRSANLLSKADHFTFSTNHGVMQNIALLYVAVAFPELPMREQYVQLAIGRLQEQFSFFVNEEGVVLEHSAGYHEFGLELMGMVLRYMTLLDLPIPDDWAEKYAKVKVFYAQLRRPDGTLPMFGNTDNSAGKAVHLVELDEQGRASELFVPKNWTGKQPEFLAPVAGYAIWWSGFDEDKWEERSTQTVIAWSNFEGHGHKHADELSVLFWGGGQTWWTNIGYWSYGSKYLGKAWSWDGANAPHFENEDAKSPRKAELLFYGSKKDLSVVDVQRRNEDGYVARRQVARIGDDLWLVLDNVEDTLGRPTQYAWTTFPDVSVRKGNFDEGYRLSSPHSRVSLEVAFLGSSGSSIEQLRGSLEPFVGLVAMAREVYESEAFNVRIPGSGWVATVWKISFEGEGLQRLMKPVMSDWKGPEDWQLSIPLAGDELEIRREQASMEVREGGVNIASVLLVRPDREKIEERLSALKSGFQNAADKYKGFRLFYPYRLKVTYLLLALLVFQELLFFAARRFYRRSENVLHMLSSGAWAAMAFWLQFFYFAN